MKKSLLIAASALLVLASCTNDDSAPEQNEISFKAINYKSTRAAINTTAYPTNIPFGIFAYYLPVGSTWALPNSITPQAYMDNINVAYDGTGDIYKPSIKYYWPNQGSLTFVAYSPKKANASYDLPNKTLTVSNYSCESVVGGNFTNQSDLMYSNAGDAADKKVNNTNYNEPNPDTKGVQIKFRHALSQLRFYAKPYEASTTTQFNVLKVVLKDIQNKGNLTIKEDNISGTGSGWAVSQESTDKKSFTPYDVTETTPYDNTTGVALPINAASYTRIGGDDNNLLVIPQVFFIADGADEGDEPDFINSICKIEVTYRMWVNGTIDAGIKTKSVLVSNIIDNFKPNEIYNMYFTISADEILFAPQIVSWDSSIEESFNGELK